MSFKKQSTDSYKKMTASPKKSTLLSRFSRKKFLFSITALLLAIPLLLYAFGVLPTRHKPYHIIYVGKTSDYKILFWRSIRSGLETAAAEFAVNLEMTASQDEGQVEENIALLQAAAAKKPDAIILVTAEYTPLKKAVAEAVAAGNRIIVMDSDVEHTSGLEPLSLVATNNSTAGQKSASALCTQLEPASKVLILTQQKGAAPADQREAGATQVLQENGMNIVATVNAFASKERAYSELNEFLTNQQVDGIVALNEFTTEAAAEWLRDKKKSDEIKLVGIDGSRGLVPYLENGILQATVLQQPFNMGYISLRSAVEAIEGQKLLPNIDIEAKMVTKENLYSPEIQKLLFPFVESD